MQRFVLFDLDNTLVDRKGTLIDWATVFAARHGLRDEGRGRVLGMLADRAYPSSFEAIRAEFGLAVPAEALWLGYCADMAALVSCPRAVLDGLSELRAAGWRVGVATNGATDIQMAKIEAAGIGRRVDGVCVSEAVDSRKPETEHFRAAAERCGTILGRGGWMVGDNPVNDMGGARSAGLGTIWVANGSAWPPDLPEPDHHVPHTRAAIDLLLRRDETRNA